MALGSGAGGGGLNRVIRRQRRRHKPTGTTRPGRGTPATRKPTRASRRRARPNKVRSAPPRWLVKGRGARIKAPVVSHTSPLETVFGAGETVTSEITPDNARSVLADTVSLLGGDPEQVGLGESANLDSDLEKLRRTEPEDVAIAAASLLPLGRAGALGARVLGRGARAVRAGDDVAKAVREANAARAQAVAEVNKAARRVGAGGAKGGTVSLSTARRAAKAEDALQKANAARIARQGGGAGGRATVGQRVAAKLEARTLTKRGLGRRVLRKGPKGSTKQSRITGAAGGTGLGGAAVAQPALTGGPSGNEGVQNIAQAPVQLGRTAVENPAEFAHASGRSLRDSLLGIPGALEAIATDPKGAVDAIIEDYKYRYGPLVEGNTAKFRKRALEGGLTPYAFDALVVAPPVGRVAGAAARSGALGPAVREFVTRARPKVQVGTGVVRSQRVSKNLGGVIGQRTLDRARGRATARRAEAGQGAALAAREAGNVVPLRHKKAQRVDVAREKGQAIQSMHNLIGEEVGRGVMREARYSLSRNERRGVQPAIALGIREPSHARHELAKRIEDIKAGRAAEGDFDAPKGWDNIPQLEKLIADADKVFTPRLAQFARQQVERGKRLAEFDPGVAPEQAARRRVAQQAEHLGVERDVPEPALGREGALNPTAETLPKQAIEGLPDVERGQLTEVSKRYNLVVDKVDSTPRGTRVSVRLEPKLYKGIKRAPNGRFYDSDLATLRNGHVVLKQDTGYSTEFAFEPEEGIIYRGVSAAELEDIQRTGRIRSNGDYNIGDQRGTTLFAENPRTALSYASGYAPWQMTPSFDTPAYVLKVRRSGLRERDGQVSGEVALEGDIPRSAIVDVVEARPYEIKPGTLDILDRGVYGDSGTMLGSRSTPLTHNAYRRVGINGFFERLGAARREAGLEEGGYFPSKIKRGPLRSAFALGGRRAVKGPKRYTGKLMRLGIEDHRIHALAEGFAQNIKRAFNWNLVADTFNRHALPFARGQSMFKVLEEINRRGLDENSVVLWNPDRFRAAEGRAHDLDADASDDPQIIGAEGMDDALKDSVMSPAHAQMIANEYRGHANIPEAFERAQGWYLLPKAVFEEMEASAKETLLGRVANIATQKQSRFLLGALNIPWFKFQVMSNGILTGLGGTGPLDLAKAQVWWKGLSRAEKKAVEPYIGHGHFQTDVRQTKLGAATDNRIVNAWRALKETTGGKAIWAGRKRQLEVRDLNPLDLMFRADNAQNNFFRRGVLYSQLKRDAYRRMGEDMGKAAELQERAMGFFNLGPKDKMAALAREVPTLERHAQHVRDFLGDYTAFTARERAFLKRHVLFYAWLRFSLRFTFYTMPVKHPVVTGIIGTLGRLHAEEVRDMLGGDQLPYALGRIYSADGKMSVDFARANPVLNALTQATATGLSGNLASFTGLLPPIYGSVLSQVFSKEPFTGKPFRVQGETQDRRYVPIEGQDRLRIALDQGLSMFYPYRVAEELTYQGRPASSDSLAFDPRYTRYKDEEIKRDIRQTHRRVAGQGLGTQVFQQLFPEFPQPSRDIAIARDLREKRREEREALGLRRRRSSSGSSSGAPSWLFPSSSSSSSSSSTPGPPSWLYD